MHNTKNGNKRLLFMSRVAPKRDTEEMDTVVILHSSRATAGRLIY